MIVISLAPLSYRLSVNEDGLLKGTHIRLGGYIRKFSQTAWDARARTSITLKRYLYYSPTTETLYLPRYDFETFCSFLQLNGVAYKTETLPISHGIPIKAKMQSWAVPRDNQIPAIASLTEGTDPMRGLALNTGIGKTFCTITAIVTMGVRAMICVTGLIDQWIREIVKFTDIAEDDIYVIQGSSTMKRLLVEIDQTVHPKIILCSLGTLRNYATDKESYEQHPLFDDIYTRLGVGVRVIDEAHLNFWINYIIDLRSNTSVTIPLSATFDRADIQVKNIFDRHYPTMVRFGEGTYERYIDIYSYSYSLGGLSPKSYMTPKGYSQVKFEEHLLLRRQKLEYLYRHVYSPIIYAYYLNRYKAGEKMLILCGRVSMCAWFKEKLDEDLPKHLNLRVGVYADGIPDSICEESDMIISTVGSAGAGSDIKKLRVVMMTIATGSATTNKQTLGRLRDPKDGIAPIYAYTWCRDIPPHFNYEQDRREIYRLREPSQQTPLSTANLIQEALLDIPDGIQVCATFRPQGIPIQLFFENAVLKCIFRVDTDQDITHICPCLTMVIDNEFLHDNTHGDFDLCGDLWMSEFVFNGINHTRKKQGLVAYKTMEDALTDIMQEPWRVHSGYKKEIYFTPFWSYALIASGLFETYEQFLETMKSDFPYEHHVVFQVFSCDNPMISEDRTSLNRRTVEKFCQKKSGFDEKTAPRDVSNARSVYLIYDDLANVEANGDCIKLIAEIPFIPEPVVGVLDCVEAEPDRTGRIRPVLTYTNYAREDKDVIQQDLIDLEDLAIRNYAVDDVVEITFPAGIPRLGRIIRKGVSDEPNPITTLLKTKDCPCCRRKLSKRGNQLYCYSPSCPSVLIERLAYACSPPVLDIPITYNDLVHMVFEYEEGVLNLPRLLSLGYSDFFKYMGTPEAGTIVETLKTRHRQFYGVGYPSDVKFITQGRFLDALSLRGMSRNNVALLQIALSKDKLHWSEIAHVLRDRRFLRKLDIPKDDVVDIVVDATYRKSELKDYAYF
ncbi:unnamed protein product [Sphagnum jensenii]|uniref:Helicase ATP-binding domain-containing protein n=1 Tax=Sphagnum jensenii TaxID=128206 RepID=A0ABP0VGG7_9BRYO